MSAVVSTEPKRVRVRNTRDQDFVFPPVKGSRHKQVDGSPGKDWPALRIPSKGSYNVLVEYLDLVRGPKATAGARKAYEQATTDYGNGPMLIVSENPRDIKAREGIEPPKSLQAYGEEQAIVIVNAVDDADALRLWLKNEKRDAVREALEKRLREVK